VSKYNVLYMLVRQFYLEPSYNASFYRHARNLQTVEAETLKMGGEITSHFVDTHAKSTHVSVLF